jgi:hypothetical protein
MYAAIDNPRVILGIALLLTPALLMAWAWLRLIYAGRSDSPTLFRSPLVILLFLMTVSYALTLLAIFNHTVGRYVDRWHGFDVGIYFLISLFACIFSLIGQSPIRRQVFSAGLLLSVLYFWVIWASMA